MGDLVELQPGCVTLIFRPNDLLLGIFYGRPRHEREAAEAAAEERTTMLENGDVWPKFEDGIAAAAAESEKEAHSSLISFRRCPYMTSTEKGKGVKTQDVPPNLWTISTWVFWTEGEGIRPPLNFGDII